MTRVLGSTWVRAIVTAGILVWMATRIDMREAARALIAVSPLSLAVVALLVAADRAVMIWRWILLLRSTGAPVDAPTAARIFLVSSFVGGFLPAGIGGDAARAWSLAQHTSRGSEAVASVAVDRVLGVIAVAIIGALGVVVVSSRLPAALRGWAYTAATLALIGSVAALWADALTRPFLRGGGNLTRRLGRLTGALGAYRQTPRVLAGVLALSALVQLLRIVQAYGLGTGLGIAVPFAYYLVFMPISLLVLLLPVSISGFGIPQGVIVGLLTPLGVPPAAGFALSTLIVLSGIAGNLPGAWLYLRRRAAVD